MHEEGEIHVAVGSLILPDSQKMLSPPSKKSKEIALISEPQHVCRRGKLSRRMYQVKIPETTDTSHLSGY